MSDVEDFDFEAMIERSFPEPGEGTGVVSSVLSGVGGYGIETETDCV